MNEDTCPKCNRKVDLEYPEDEHCPYCQHGGCWVEEYNEYNYWMVWEWDSTNISNR